MSDFSKEERVAFEDILEGFNDALVLSRNVSVYSGLTETEDERTNDIVWRPQPYVGVTYDGQDQSSNFTGYTQLSVPSTIGYYKSAPWIMDAKELRDRLQEGRIDKGARQRLASDINVAVMNVASLYGTNWVKRTAAASGFDDISQCDSLFNEIGVNTEDRYIALAPRDYNSMASNLASRATMNKKPETAYEKALIDSNISGFMAYKMQYAYRLQAAAGGGSLTMDTRASANNYYTPVATRTAATGERSNVDNRFQQVTISSTTGVAAGDAFTVAGVNAVHLIAKQDTGQLKTFRVVSVDSSTTMTVTPPIISNQGSTRAEEEYQNCVVTEASAAAIVFLNTVAANVSPFWHRDAIELRPSTIAVPSDAGMAVMRGSTDQGIEVVMMKQANIDNTKTKYRIDTRFGVTAVQPEMMGGIQFSQT